MKERKSQSRAHFPWLDWLRFGAAFLVVLAHGAHLIYEKSAYVGGNNWLEWFYINVLCGLGHEGVLIFFTLSGYFVLGPLIARTQEGSFDAIRYGIDRFTRIFPPLFATVLATLLVTWFLGEEIRWINVLVNLTSTQGILGGNLQNNPSFWTLSYEVWFYVLGGGLALAACGKNLSRWIGYSFFFLAMVAFTELRTSYLFCWLIGGCFFAFAPNNIGRNVYILGWALMFCFYYMRVDLNFIPVLSDTLDFVRGQAHAAKLIFSLGAGIVITYLSNLKVQGRFAKWLESLGPTLAASSYSLYLVHFPVILFFQRTFELNFSSISYSSLLAHLMVVVASVFVGLLLWFFVEKHTAHFRELSYRVIGR